MNNGKLFTLSIISFLIFSTRSNFFLKSVKNTSSLRGIHFVKVESCLKVVLVNLIQIFQRICRQVFFPKEDDAASKTPPHYSCTMNERHLVQGVDQKVDFFTTALVIIPETDM